MRSIMGTHFVTTIIMAAGVMMGLDDALPEYFKMISLLLIVISTIMVVAFDGDKDRLKEENTELKKKLRKVRRKK